MALCGCLILAVSVQAQLLPDNKSLNTQSVQRWMQSNRAMAPLVQRVDAEHTSDSALKAFEALAPELQDQQIELILKNNHLSAQAKATAQQYGWASVGEYMRLSSRLGNAIAAYFLFGDLGRVTKEQARQLKEKADPAVLAVPQQDIDFIRRNEKPLQKYIQAYAAGR